MAPLHGKVAIVTGAGRGIGSAIASRLAHDGAEVVVHFGRSKKEAEALAKSLGGIALGADMAKPGEIRELFEKVSQNFGRLDILVNNAGVAEFAPVVSISDEQFERVFNVNCRGAFVALQEAARRISRGGRIVNISTGATVGGTPGGSIYCGSKAALEQFTRALALELAPKQVTVNTVSPGFTETDMFRQFPGLEKRAMELTPLGRLGAPEDIADVIGFLVSDQARWITGQNIHAGGGASMV